MPYDNMFQAMNLGNPMSFPKFERTSKHMLQPRGFPSNPRNAKRPKLVSTTEKLSHIPSLEQKLIQDGLKSAENDKDWMLILSKDTEKISDLITGLPEDDKLLFKEKFERAKSIWSCSACTSFSLNNSISGFITCTICSQRSHRVCVNFNPTSDEYAWSCSSCSLPSGSSIE